MVTIEEQVTNKRPRWSDLADESIDGCGTDEPATDCRGLRDVSVDEEPLERCSSFGSQEDLRHYFIEAMTNVRAATSATGSGSDEQERDGNARKKTRWSDLEDYSSDLLDYSPELGLQVSRNESPPSEAQGLVSNTLDQATGSLVEQDATEGQEVLRDDACRAAAEALLLLVPAKVEDVEGTREAGASSGPQEVGARMDEEETNISGADWERRLEKRWAIIMHTKDSDEYKAHLQRVALRGCNRARVARRNSSVPRTPDPTNRKLSKRMWEKTVAHWRLAIKRRGAQVPEW